LRSVECVALIGFSGVAVKPCEMVTDANLDTTTGMWTSPTAGLWQFTFSIFYQAYAGYPSWNLYQNGTVVTLIEQASNSTQWLTSGCKWPWLLLARVDDCSRIYCCIIRAVAINIDSGCSTFRNHYNNEESGTPEK